MTLPKATTELEEALRLARERPYDVEFSTRVKLALALAQNLLSDGGLEAARQLLDEEAKFADQVVELVKLAGEPAQRRAATAGRTQILDRAAQVELLGRLAPELSIADWIAGDAVTLESLAGKVVLLEFWATWCKPCKEMFSKLKKLDDKYRSEGLETIAITRYYLSENKSRQSCAAERALIESIVLESEVSFRVAVAPDEKVQTVYGANGVPTVALIDRNGIVRYANFTSPGDVELEKHIKQALEHAK